MRKPLAKMEKHTIFFGIIALFFLQQHETFALSSVVENFNQAYADCATATTNADCRAKGCSYDCIDKLCLPKQYECLKSRASSPCFHLCGDDAACQATLGCREVDGFCLSENEEKPSSIAPRANWNSQTWTFLADCRALCTPKPFRPYACVLDPHVTLQEMCARSENINHKCCQDPPPSPPPPPPVTETTTTEPTVEPTTEPTPPGPPGPPEDPDDLYCRTLTAVEDCRKDPKCAYDCGDNKCVKKEKINEECSQGCSQFCHDPCGCKAAAGGTCEYSVLHNRCMPRPLHCTNNWFPGDPCRRKDHFYVFGGVLCHNDEDSGKCAVTKNILSVNANGRKHRDKRGIDHKADSEVAFEDIYGGRQTFYFSHSRLQDVDRYLFENLVSAIGHGTDKRQCLRYAIPLREDGNYEITIKTYEPFAKRLKRRMFNIELHDVVVVSNLDIFAVVGKDEPMSIVVNFLVYSDSADQTRKFITIPGYAPMAFVDSIKLGFCVGECRLDNRFFWEIGNYVVSAFSVLKLE